MAREDKRKQRTITQRRDTKEKKHKGDIEYGNLLNIGGQRREETYPQTSTMSLSHGHLHFFCIFCE